MKRILVVCTTDSMIWNFLVPHIKELQNAGHYVECACSKTGFFFEELSQKYNLKMNAVCFKRSPFSFQNIKAFNQLCRIIKTNRIDTIFCHEPVGGALGRLAGHKCKCNVIYMAHGFHFYKGAPKVNTLYYLIEKYLAKYTDVLITINKEDYEASLRFSSRFKIMTHGIGVDTSIMGANNSASLNRAIFNIGKDSLVLLSVGELIPRKNHIVVIKALKKLGNKNIYYFIAGQGALYKQLTKVIHSYKLQENVYLLGYRRDINDLCVFADLFVLPSIQEGLSVALMEAMACGKPVICSNIRGNVDLIDENLGGFCVPNSVNDYCKALDFFVRHRDMAAKYGEYNRNKVSSYDINIVKKEIIEAFNLL